MPSVRCTCLWAVGSRQAVVQISAQRRHAPVLFSCGKQHVQGVWGAARPPSGEREGQRPLASTLRSDTQHGRLVSALEQAGWPFACAAGGQGHAPRGIPCATNGAVRLRGRRPGATRPPAPPARDAVPWNPDSMHAHAKRQMHMPLGSGEPPSGSPALGTTEACAGALMMRQATCAGGLGGGSPAQRGARGAAPARIHAAMRQTPEAIATFLRCSIIQM
jgi:hypothetical protein